MYLYMYIHKVRNDWKMARMVARPEKDLFVRENGSGNKSRENTQKVCKNSENRVKSTSSDASSEKSREQTSATASKRNV